MLQTKDLVKIYKPKKGVPVTALDKVTLTFPEKGMVFLLGKSGSGKSTLLNVLGGLDNYDNGEITIKGVSSKDFKQKHFDSYRNTYVGFIFQEYNVLDEFSVGANIALAIELQNRKATDSEVNGILKEVDLEGFGNRKPNELSGGQKQRVAIARALVKNPEIIMADEPTGALDSNTGKQIFETLKKLSKDKLVIVVSHDREFAENYADRIIELADGKVISDVELDTQAPDSKEKGIIFGENTIELPSEYHITDEDRKAIFDYIENLQKGTVSVNVTGKGLKRFIPTNTDKIKLQDGSGFNLIKSKLSFKNAFKIGAGALKHKKFRLVMTILLSCISFGLFGLADTFGAYNHIETCTNSLYDTGFEYVAMVKSKKVTDRDYVYWDSYGHKLSDVDLKTIKNDSGTEMHGVYVPLNADLSFTANIDENVELSKTNYNIYTPRFNGFAEISDSIVKNMGFKILAGKLPDGEKDEIAVSEYVLEIFKKAKYTDGTLSVSENGTAKLKYSKIEKAEDLVGKKLSINGKKYTVAAVVDTNFDMNRYISLTEESEFVSETDDLVNHVLYREFDSAMSYSYSSLIMTEEGYIEKLISERPKIHEISNGYLWFSAENYGVDSNYLARFSDMTDQKITWIGDKKTELGEKELIVTSDILQFWNEEGISTESEEIAEKLKNGETLTAYMDMFDGEGLKQVGDYKVVGIIEQDENSDILSTVVCSDSLFYKFVNESEMDSYYTFAVGVMPESKSDIKSLVSYCYREDTDIRYQIENSVTYELDTVNELLQEFSKIFLYIGLGFAAFAALMLANFIGTSISYKKQEIGILRAIGSRSNDVFRIFFAESFIIAMINFLLSAIGVGVATAIVNYLVRTQMGILITILSFGIRQVVLLLAVSVLVAFVASYLPVKKIASKRPIDAIRNR